MICFSTALGNVKEKVLPFSISLSTQILPLCASIIDLVIGRPKPVPPAKRVDEESTCLNFSKSYQNVLLQYLCLYQ